MRKKFVARNPEYNRLEGLENLILPLVIQKIWSMMSDSHHGMDIKHQKVD